MQEDKDLRNRLHLFQKYSWPVVFGGLMGIFLFLFFNQPKTPNPDMNTVPKTEEPVAPKNGIRADSITAVKKTTDSV